MPLRGVRHTLALIRNTLNWLHPLRNNLLTHINLVLFALAWLSKRWCGNGPASLRSPPPGALCDAASLQILIRETHQSSHIILQIRLRDRGSEKILDEGVSTIIYSERTTPVRSDRSVDIQMNACRNLLARQINIATVVDVVISQ